MSDRIEQQNLYEGAATESNLSDNFYADPEMRKALSVTPAETRSEPDGISFDNPFEKFSDGVSSNSDSPVAMQIMDFLVAKGFTPPQAAGIVGNFQRESGNNPATEESNGIGFGLAQWSYERRVALENFAAEQGKPVDDLSMQLDFMWNELNTTESATLDAFKANPNMSAAEAAATFEELYERAGIVALAERQDYANKFLEQYNNGGAGGTSSTSQTLTAQGDTLWSEPNEATIAAGSGDPPPPKVAVAETNDGGVGPATAETYGDSASPGGQGVGVPAGENAEYSKNGVYSKIGADGNFGGDLQVIESGGMVFPVAGYSGKAELHWGENRGAADLMAERGTPVVAMMGGRVVWSTNTDIGGYNVGILQRNGLTAYYAHMDQPPLVAQDQIVETGQQIGVVGNSGNAKDSDPHLHFAVGTSISRGVGAPGGTGFGVDNYQLLNSILNSGSSMARRI